MELEERQDILLRLLRNREPNLSIGLQPKEEKLNKKPKLELKEMEEKARLASMTPVQRLIDSYNDITVLINDMRNGKIEDFDTIKEELAQEVKKIIPKPLNLG